MTPIIPPTVFVGIALWNDLTNVRENREDVNECPCCIEGGMGRCNPPSLHELTPPPRVNNPYNPNTLHPTPSHSVLLHPTLSHSIPLCPTLSHSVPLCPTPSHSIPLHPDCLTPSPRTTSLPHHFQSPSSTLLRPSLALQKTQPHTATVRSRPQQTVRDQSR